MSSETINPAAVAGSLGGLRIVRCVNPGDGRKFRARYDNQWFELEPGQETIVPLGALILWAGNPESRNLDARRRFRVGEVNRLRTKYGAYEKETLWERNKPTIQFFTMEGERITTVVEDPEGTGTPFSFGDETSDASMTAKLADMEKQMGEIQAMIADGRLIVNLPAMDTDDEGAKQGGQTAVEESPGGAVTIEDQGDKSTPLITNSGEEGTAAIDPADPASSAPPEDVPTRVPTGQRTRTK